MIWYLRTCPANLQNAFYINWYLIEIVATNQKFEIPLEISHFFYLSRIIGTMERRLNFTIHTVM